MNVELSPRAGDGIPAGWALVPTEPTPEMESECMGLLMSEALIYERSEGGLAVETIAPVKLWAAMLAAAPAAPSVPARVSALRTLGGI